MSDQASSHTPVLYLRLDPVRVGTIYKEKQKYIYIYVAKVDTEEVQGNIDTHTDWEPGHGWHFRWMLNLLDQ